MAQSVNPQSDGSPSKQTQANSVTREGWLMHEEGNSKLFRRAYFVLANGTLSSFDLVLKRSFALNSRLRLFNRKKTKYGRLPARHCCGNKL